MSMPARAVGAPSTWSEEDWTRALSARPDLLERLNAGDAAVLAEMVELMPGASAKVTTVTPRQEAP